MTEKTEALRLAEQLEAIGLHGPVAAELRRLHPHELANEVWQVKTQWVQDTAKPEELGMHRADVMRQRLVRAETQRDALLEAYRKMKNVAAGYSNLCDDSASTSKLEREFEAADAIARAAIKAMEGEKT